MCESRENTKDKEDRNQIFSDNAGSKNNPEPNETGELIMVPGESDTEEENNEPKVDKTDKNKSVHTKG